MESQSVLIWKEGIDPGIVIGLFLYFLIAFLYGWFLNRWQIKSVLAITRHPGRAVADFVLMDRAGPTLMNMALVGMSCLIYIIVIGGDLSGPVVGAILTAFGFAAFGVHLKNFLPVLAGVVLLFGDPLLRIYTDEPTVLVKCKEALLVSMLTFPINGILEAVDTVVRGMGYAVTSRVASMAGICGVRLLWIYTVFAAYPSLTTRYLSYPVGWILTSLVDVIALAVIWRKLPKENAPLPELDGQNL